MQNKVIFINLTIVLHFIELIMVTSIAFYYIFTFFNFIGQSELCTNSPRIEALNSYDAASFLYKLNLNSMQTDTIKLKDSIATTGRYYLISGSYLIPKNADNQVLKLKKMGFIKCFKFNFPESEYYSVVLDSANLPNQFFILTEKLQKLKIDYFIKHP